MPDVSGCFSYGDTIEEAISNAKEAVVDHIGTLLELGEPVDLKSQEAFKDAAWGLGEVDLTELDSKPERVNISLPKFVLHRIDEYVASKHETRSSFIARVAFSALAQEQ